MSKPPGAFSAFQVVGLLSILLSVQSASVTESSSLFTFQNDLLSFNVVKKNGYIQNLTYDGVSLLGSVSGNAGQLYTDFPSKAFALTGNTAHEVVSGEDWVGIILTDNDTAGSLVQRSWFLRDREVGELGEVRTMFRPNNGPWTILVANEEQWAPIPSADAIANQIEVQGATWYLGNTPSDGYVQQESDYWTKYTFADNQTNKAHGLYGAKPDGTPLAVWWVINQNDAYFGGPTHVDLTVDGIIYNKYSTNHGGATSPNITDGFDRTFGPQFLYFNQGKKASHLELLKDAQALADPAWNAEFYDTIAPHVPGYVVSAKRGQFVAKVTLPEGASKPVAVLSANGVHFQDSAVVPGAYQYWTDIKEGEISLNRVKEGTYRLTVYASGVFGDYTQDNIVVKADCATTLNNVLWDAESAGTELWRIGTPDKTAGEFRNGFERDLTHPNQPAKYRIYWGAWDFPSQFPGGVNFTIGKSKEAIDWNYVHWSQYGPTYIRNNTVTDINRWQINFDLTNAPAGNSIATFTIQLAAAKTTAGNTDNPQGSNPNFNISTFVNDQTTSLDWEIQWFESSSCGERSAISCHLLSRKVEFPGTWLKRGYNKFVLALPHAAPVYVQYDALRLELR
ncbi:unnamed protein product [Somion occarium]|uniref:rhamnogalacturonan endolyase n=1 Tax=Somion occarium TaxID=3059160 RepID=A0ABP1E9P6_9APHY